MREQIAAALDQAAAAMSRIPGGTLAANIVLAPLRPDVPCTRECCADTSAED